jgi:hypothetical protein
MRKLIGAIAAVLTLALAPAAMGHPSENRALQGFGGPGAPHCHINQQTGNFAFPSHKAHIATGLDGRIFVAAATCPE